MLRVSKSETGQLTRRNLTERWKASFLAGTVTAEQEAMVRSRANMWLRRVRGKCEDAVIERAGDSMDYLGKPITGLVLFEQHPCVISLYDHEYKALERAAERALDSETFVRWFASEVGQRTCFFREQADEVMQNFYLDIRKTLLHPWCGIPEDTKESAHKLGTRTYEEYQVEPSGKLEMLLNILGHHLKWDGAPGLDVAEQEQLESQYQQQEQQGRTLPPDKIVIHSYFASSFWLIKLVSDFQSEI